MIEGELAKAMFQGQGEKTFIDKILARTETDKLGELIQKDPLERKDLLQILYLLSGTESKLVNYNEWDRYVILKFFVWIRDFVKICELMYDYKDDIVKGKIKIGPRAMHLLNNNERLMQHNAKFLIDLYLNISRSTLSIGGMGLLEILKNKFEISYPQMAQAGAGTKPVPV